MRLQFEEEEKKNGEKVFSWMARTMILGQKI